MAKKALSWVYLYGGPSVGKGFFVRIARRRYGARIGVIGIGDLARRRRTEDAEFEQTYGAVMDGGYLLENKPACQLMSAGMQSLDTSSCELVIVDGFGRTVPQVDWLHQHNLLEHPVVTFYLDCTREIRQQREADKRKRQADGERKDFTGFDHREEAFTRNQESVLERHKKFNSPVVTLNANGDLERTVFPHMFVWLETALGSPAPHPDQPTGPPPQELRYAFWEPRRASASPV